MSDRIPLIKINVRISPALLEAAQLAAETEDRNFSAIVRLALRTWLENNGYEGYDA